ncbi:flagellin [Methanocaldococcus indicus]|uniref:flagellin n=1 Tax=Methanocaldococcus indicus TaxID=213231 RepID=UPI003C6D346C
MNFIKSKKGAIGIGTLIIFIALVLVASIAAAVIINTAANLQHKAARVGEESTKQVASGIQVIKVVGYTPDKKSITKMLIFISPNVGDEIDLSTLIVTLSDGVKKISLVYDNNSYLYTPALDGLNGLFTSTVANDSVWTPLANDIKATNDGGYFGIIVLQDGDGSLNNTAHPTANFGDKVALAVDLSDLNMQITPREKVYGEVIPEYGASGIIEFYAPSTFTENIVPLQ